MNCCTELHDEAFSIFSSWTKMTLLMVQQVLLILAILAAQSQASSNAKNKLKLKWELIFRCKTRWRFNVCCPVDVSVFNKE